MHRVALFCITSRHKSISVMYILTSEHTLQREHTTAVFTKVAHAAAAHSTTEHTTAAPTTAAPTTAALTTAAPLTVLCSIRSSALLE